MLFFSSLHLYGVYRCVCERLCVLEKKNCKAHSCYFGNWKLRYGFCLPLHAQRSMRTRARVNVCNAQLMLHFQRKHTLPTHTNETKKNVTIKKNNNISPYIQTMRCDADIEIDHVGLAHRYSL